MNNIKSDAFNVAKNLHKHSMVGIKRKKGQAQKPMSDLQVDKLLKPTKINTS
jgi:hypothetical protein